MAERLIWTRLTGLFKNQHGGRVGFLKKDRTKEWDGMVAAIREVIADPTTKQLMFSARTFKEGENPVLSMSAAPIQEKKAPATQAGGDDFGAPTPPPSQDVEF